MRLVRIEAERFGGIDARSLGDLSPNLTVVLGPNEAGKSSMTALVRHLLYGFPTPASSEPAYVSPSGKRQGRLVFTDAAGEWVLERVEGPHGGPVTVRALSGVAREGLADDLTRGVSRAAYRVVFGFGLDEMQQIGQPTGKDDDLMRRLYAAGAGLTVSPPDIRAKLTERAETLWKKGGSVPRVNKARSERAALRAEIKQLEDEADSFRAEAERLSEIDERLVAARRERADTQARSERLTRTVGEVERLMAESTAAARRAEQLGRDAADARRSAATVVIDEPSLQAAEAVRSLGAGEVAFSERLSALADQRSRLAAAEQRLRASLDEAGWTEEQALAAAGDAGITTGIESARAELEKLRTRLELAVEERDRTASEVAGADAGVTAPPAAGRAWLLPGLVAAGLGLVGLVAGLAIGQVALAVFGAVVALAGAALAFVRMPSAHYGPDGGQARSRFAAAEASVASARRALDERAAAWAECVRGWGLGSGDEDPASAAVRLQAARDARGADRDRTAIREAIAAEQMRVDAYVDRVRSVVAPLLGEDDAAVTAERCAEFVARATLRVEAALESERARNAALALAEGIDAEAEAAGRAAAVATEAAKAELLAVGIADGDLEQVRQAASQARLEAEESLGSFDVLAEQAATLRAKVNAESRDDRLAGLRLRWETVGEQMAADVREYAVLALAAQLLKLAQERYELERQPEVLTRAQAAFSLMTNGRYPRLSIPLGTNAIEVFTASASGVGPDKLSRGTAEQLYLALRLGLVDQLGEIGAGLPVLMDDVLVNFSPDRLEPAALAIADLAQRRQVVFFTCHPDMADLVCRVAPDAVRIALEGPAARKA